MCRKILEEDELPWRRRSAGRSFLRPVSVILIMPWDVSRVKSGIMKGGDWAFRALEVGGFRARNQGAF